MNKIFLLVGILFSFALMAKTDQTADFLPENNEINKKDNQGRKQGLWVVFGKDIPRKGYPEKGKVEEGNYTDNRKNGFWTIYHMDGETPRLIGEFVDGRPKGEYKKMYSDGKVKEEGHFEDGKQVGSLIMYHENGKVAQKKYFSVEGVEEGPQKIFYRNGQVEVEYQRTHGVTVGTATRYTKKGEVKEIIQYSEDGSVASRVEKEITIQKPDEGNGGPNGSNGNMRGKVFEKDGYNKVYNENEELWLDGKFKNGKLWKGKLYKYDSDGILLKIEVWKNGKYHSDGQL